MNKEQFLDALKDFAPDYELVGEFVRQDKITTFLHKTCGETFEIQPRSLLQSRVCKICKKNEAKKSFQEKLNKHRPGEFEVLEFDTLKTASKIKHLKCATVFTVAPVNILKTFNCPTCGENNRKMSQEEFLIQLHNVAPQYELLDVFDGIKKLNRFKCLYCGEIFESTPRTILKGEYICKGCKKANNGEKFKNEVLKKSNGEFQVLTYTDRKSMIKVYHSLCGKTFETTPRQLLLTMNCPYCGYNHKLSQEEFEDKVEEVWGKEYEVLGIYDGYHAPILVKHKKCGHEWEVDPANFLSGHGCPKCANNQKKSPEEFKSQVKKLTKDEYKVIGEYENNRIPVKLVHINCPSNNNKDFEFEMRPSDFVSKAQRCPLCGGTMKWDTEKFKNAVKNLEGSEYEVLSEYVNMHTKIQLKHIKCGTEYWVQPYSFKGIDACRCPVCNESHGERAVRDYLSKLPFNFQAQYIIPDCKNKKPLPFDFAILGPDNVLLALIEYDGVQHYEPVEQWGGQENLEKIQENDRIKTEYCKSYNIPLLRIPYWDFDNIENIIKEFFKNNK